MAYNLYGWDADNNQTSTAYQYFTPYLQAQQAGIIGQGTNYTDMGNQSYDYLNQGYQGALGTGDQGQGFYSNTNYFPSGTGSAPVPLTQEQIQQQNAAAQLQGFMGMDTSTLLGQGSSWGAQDIGGIINSLSSLGVDPTAFHDALANRINAGWTPQTTTMMGSGDSSWSEVTPAGYSGPSADTTAFDTLYGNATGSDNYTYAALNPYGLTYDTLAGMGIDTSKLDPYAQAAIQLGQQNQAQYNANTKGDSFLSTIAPILGFAAAPLLGTLMAGLSGVTGAATGMAGMATEPILGGYMAGADILSGLGTAAASGAAGSGNLLDSLSPNIGDFPTAADWSLPQGATNLIPGNVTSGVTGTTGGTLGTGTTAFDPALAGSTASSEAGTTLAGGTAASAGTDMSALGLGSMPAAGSSGGLSSILQQLQQMPGGSTLLKALTGGIAGGAGGAGGTGTGGTGTGGVGGMGDLTNLINGILGYNSSNTQLDFLKQQLAQGQAIADPFKNNRAQSGDLLMQSYTNPLGIYNSDAYQLLDKRMQDQQLARDAQAGQLFNAPERLAQRQTGFLDYLDKYRQPLLPMSGATSSPNAANAFTAAVLPQITKAGQQTNALQGSAIQSGSNILSSILGGGTGQQGGTSLSQLFNLFSGAGGGGSTATSPFLDPAYIASENAIYGNLGGDALDYSNWLMPV